MFAMNKSRGSLADFADRRGFFAPLTQLEAFTRFPIDFGGGFM